MSTSHLKNAGEEGDIPVVAAPTMAEIDTEALSLHEKCEKLRKDRLEKAANAEIEGKEREMRGADEVIPVNGKGFSPKISNEEERGKGKESENDAIEVVIDEDGEVEKASSSRKGSRPLVSTSEVEHRRYSGEVVVEDEQLSKKTKQGRRVSELPERPLSRIVKVRINLSPTGRTMWCGLSHRTAHICNNVTIYKQPLLLYSTGSG